MFPNSFTLITSSPFLGRAHEDSYGILDLIQFWLYLMQILARRTCFHPETLRYWCHQSDNYVPGRIPHSF